MSKLNKIRDLLSQLSPKVLGSVKAIVGFVVGWAVAYLAARGIDVDEATIISIENATYGLLVALWVWFVPNKK